MRIRSIFRSMRLPEKKYWIWKSEENEELHKSGQLSGCPFGVFLDRGIWGIFCQSAWENAECKSWYLQIQRGSLKGYVRSKVWICFFSAVLATMMGTMLFVLVGRAEMPFLSEENFFYDSFATQSMFAGFLTPERILLYFIVIAFMQGILAGILAMCSMLLSLFVRNRMFTITVPVIGFYFLTTYLEKISPYLDLYNMYVYGAPVLGNNAGSFLYALVLAVILLILFDELIQLKMEREMKR